MPSPLIVSADRALPVSVENAFDRTIVLPLPELMCRRYGVLPAVRSVDGFTSPWGSGVGQTRRIDTADGGGMTETLLLVDRPHRFAYQLGSISGPMKALAASVEGEWAFEPAGTGTRVTWSWTVRAANGAASVALPAFGRMWQGYARQSLEELERALVH